MSESARYKIVRGYQWEKSRHLRRTIRSGLTLEEAQRWCHDPETSSSTCTGSRPRRRTLERGPWFDGYEQEQD